MLKTKDNNNKLEYTYNFKNDGNLYDNFEKMWQKHWFQYILNNPDKPWYYYYLSLNPRDSKP